MFSIRTAISESQLLTGYVTSLLILLSLAFCKKTTTTTKIYIYKYLAVPSLCCGMWGPQLPHVKSLVAAWELLGHVGSSSLTRDSTQAPSIGSTGRQPLNHQGSPWALLFYLYCQCSCQFRWDEVGTASSLDVAHSRCSVNADFFPFPSCCQP